LEEEGKAEEKQKTEPVKSNQSWDLLVTVVLPHPAGGKRAAEVLLFTELRGCLQQFHDEH
jgi:hypothetical protein